ncbi:MAG: hypothetical protein A2010_18950 [Nitrospirae bacterium GWD2_57_9]|nr:MAG: hypothetical protein A2010_18950 [Nitrospirae bacterium GWD2_57_9]
MGSADMKHTESAKRRHFGSILTMVLVASVLLAGCVQKGPILVDAVYQVPVGVTPDRAPEAVVGLIPFKDERGKTDSVAGKRFNSLSDTTNDLVVQGTVSDKVTTAVRRSLVARDITVKELAGWDLTEPGIPAAPVSLVLSGEIKTFWAEAVSSVANTKVTARVEVRVVAADPVQKKIVRVLNVNSSLERTNVTFSSAFVEATMSEALSAAINQIFSDQEFANGFK